MTKADEIKGSNELQHLVDTLIELKLASSRREAREFIRNGAVSLNGDKVTDEALVLSSELAIEGKISFDLNCLERDFLNWSFFCIF